MERKQNLSWQNKSNLLMPSSVKNPSIEIKRFHICTKGKNHAQQPLDLVCLDPICRDNPLICATCFSGLHKSHKTIPLEELLSDYQGAIHRNHKNTLLKRINYEHENLTNNLIEFKSSLIQKLNHYEQTVQEYFNYLQTSLNIRSQLQRTLNINLQPQKIIESRSQTEIQSSLSFIINYSLFNQENRIINVSNILKCDQSRTLAMLDKICNENLKCQREIQLQFDKFKFASQALKKQGLRVRGIVDEFNRTKVSQFGNANELKINVDTKAFVQKETFYTTLNQFHQQLDSSLNQRPSFGGSKIVNSYFSIKEKEKTQSNVLTPMFVFSNVYKHENLEILDSKHSVIKSNITALKPQYALICPSVDYQPMREQNWSIKINSCRNFASSKNTVAVGLCSLNGLKSHNYEQESSECCSQRKYLLTSQGFLIKNGRQQRCELTFTSGDVLNLKYDPYFRLLTIKKQNGRKISVKIKQAVSSEQEDDGRLYACVRLTYASDQVQILNHSQGVHNVQVIG